MLSLSRLCALKGIRFLLLQLLDAFIPEGTVVVGIDETIKRRWDSKIKKRGIYRDSVRSSHSHFVKCSGLRWISLMLLMPLSWAARVWALPFLTVLAPSERYSQEAGRQNKKITDWARQMLLQLKRWLPHRQLISVGDSSNAVLDLLAAVSGQISFITRLRQDAALYATAPEREPVKPGRCRKKGERLPGLQQVLQSAATKWQNVRLNNWYGHGEKEMELATATAI